MVYFVGAGSGAADLITVRGKNLLEKADVIIYAGSLVNPELLTYAKEDCEIHNSAYMTLDEVIAVMENAEKAGKTVVRLHTGEPSIYGAVREQMDLLDENRIIVKYGLKQMEQSKNLGLRTLIEVCGLKGQKLGNYHVGFILGPCLKTGQCGACDGAVFMYRAAEGCCDRHRSESVE